MKKFIFLFALLFSVSSSFISCRENTEEAEDVELNEELETETDNADGEENEL